MTTIRSARRQDGERLAALSGELGYPMTAEEAVQRLADLETHGDHALLVAEDGGRVAGWIQVSLTRIFETPRSAEIAGLVVDSAERGRGIGRRLVDAAVAWAGARGCAAVRVRTNVIRERAHAFYVREGFREVKTQKVLEKRFAPSS
ncbi:MAG TPA: GNAT family N-acetyltransferase [Thermoanaerobaculia bacterium]|nr:GNAT family N-acetyltransferase [Thermoanaerobaculia bacterium]